MSEERKSHLHGLRLGTIIVEFWDRNYGVKGRRKEEGERVEEVEVNVGVPITADVRLYALQLGQTFLVLYILLLSLLLFL